MRVSVCDFVVGLECTVQLTSDCCVCSKERNTMGLGVGVCSAANIVIVASTPRGEK